MTSVWTRLSPAALAALLFAGAQAHADFTYTNTFDPTTFTGSGGGSLAPAFSTTTKTIVTNSAAGFTNWTPVNIVGNTSGSDTYNTGYTVTLTINDGAGSYAFVFKGILSGTFSSTGVSTLNSQLNTPDANNNPVGALTSGQVSESQVINGTTYTVKLNANWPIGALGNAQTSLNGEIDWGVSTGGGPTGGGPTGGGPTGGTQNSPEPSTMLLSFVGLSCLGASAWRRKKAARA